MKKGFTIIEVSILLIIFLIVALLVIPLSLDDSIREKSSSSWRSVQTDFNNLFYTINSQKTKKNFDFKEAFDSALSNDIKSEIKPYKITNLNGSYPSSTYRFKDFSTTNSGATISVKWNDLNDGSEVKGLLMYDVNGNVGPNVWGKDVFGYDIYSDRFEPFCKSKSASSQKQDCSKDGTGLCCSSWYLMGGSFN